MLICITFYLKSQIQDSTRNKWKNNSNFDILLALINEKVPSILRTIWKYNYEIVKFVFNEMEINILQ